MQEFVDYIQEMLFVTAMESFLETDIGLGIGRIKFRGCVIFKKVIFSKDKGVG